MTTQSINEGLWTNINGQNQWLTVRGQNKCNPALLIINGPGFALSPLASFFEPWEQDFTLIQWDQPGAGATAGKDPDTKPYTLNRLAHDGVSVARFAEREIGLGKPILLCLSAGTIVGLLMIQQHPELFSSYIGIGQFVDWRRQDALSYQALVEQARIDNDDMVLDTLNRIGPPPYADTATDAIKSAIAGAFTSAELEAMATPPGFAAAMQPPAGARYIAREVKYPDPRHQAMLMYERLRPELMGFSAWELPLTYDIPMCFIQGKKDNYSVTEEVERFAFEIQAPNKRLEVIPEGGHNTFVMRDDVLERLKLLLEP